jgi:hypothetical protein
MITLILLFLLTALLVEAITGILVKSDLFIPVRKYLFESKNRVLKFVSEILDCPYCTSVWVSLFCVCMLYIFIIGILPRILALFFLGIILHRISNIVHHVIDRLDPNHGSGQGN